MFKNVASQKVALFAFDRTTGAPKTGDSANITPYVSKDYGTVTVLGTTTATEMDATNAAGWYSFVLTQGETNADALLFSAKSSTSNIVLVGALIFTTPNRFSSMVIDAAGLADANAVKIGPSGSGTAQTARDIGASVLLSTGTGTGQLDFTSGVVKANLAQILGTALTETAGQIAAGFKQFFNIASPTSTMNLITAVTTATTATNLTNAPTAGDFTATMKTSLNAATPALSAAGVQAIWDALTSALTTVGSIGKLLVTNLDATISSRTKPADTQAAVTTVTNLTNAPTAGDFTATMKTSLNAATPAVTVSDKTGFALTSAYDAAKTAAQAGNAMTLTSGERTATADALLDRDMSAGTDSGSPTVRTVRQALRFLRNKWAVAAGTLSVYKEDDATASWTASVSTDASAVPIIGNDPAGP